MEKIDFKKKFATFYNVPLSKINIVTIPEMQFLAIDGKGDPNKSKEFQEAVEALYSVSYTLKFMIKKGSMAIDYGVLPLEGQWYMDNMNDFCEERKDEWKWTLMIMQPDFVTKSLIEAAMQQASSKKTLPALTKTKFEKSTEGLCAQIMHIGPYSEERPTIERLHKFIKENGYHLTGKHREIYLSDPRKSVPEKLKTIIRQPIKK